MESCVTRTCQPDALCQSRTPGSAAERPSAHPGHGPSWPSGRHGVVGAVAAGVAACAPGAPRPARPAAITPTAASRIMFVLARMSSSERRNRRARHSPPNVMATRSADAEDASGGHGFRVVTHRYPRAVDDTPRVDPEAAFERLALDDSSWIDVARGWLLGADEVYAHLVETVAWRQGRVWRYERWIDEPRLGA